MTENATDRSRWVALYVLCVGMLMIVLDGTVVNVALPSIQEDLGFSQSSLAWVVNAYLIAFGGLLLLAGRLGDLISRRGIFLAGLAVFTVSSVLCGVAQSQEMLIAARFLQGVGGAMASAVILGMIVTMFPEPREQAKAIGVFGFVASAGALDRPAGRRRADPVDQLALDLLRQHPDRDRRGAGRDAPDREGQGRGPRPRRRLPRRGPDHGLPDARRLHDRQAGRRHRLDLRAHPRVRRRRARAAGGLPGARVDRARAADPAADLPLAQRLRRQRDPGAVRGRDVRDVLHGRAVPAAGARLRRAADRPRVPALDDRDGHAVAALLRAADHALRRAHDADPGPRARRRRPAAVHAGAGRRQLRRARPAGDGPARRRRRDLVPRADDAVDVGRHAQRRRARVRPRQHDAAGRRRARARGARHALDDPHRRACATPATRRSPRSTAATTSPTSSAPG